MTLNYYHKKLDEYLICKNEYLELQKVLREENRLRWEEEQNALKILKEKKEKERKRKNKK